MRRVITVVLLPFLILGAIALLVIITAGLLLDRVLEP